LVKERGFTLKGAKQKKQQNPAETAQVEDVVRRLMKLREELQSFKQTL
jgi:phage terminase small subunit